MVMEQVLHHTVLCGVRSILRTSLRSLTAATVFTSQCPHLSIDIKGGPIRSAPSAAARRSISTHSCLSTKQEQEKEFTVSENPFYGKYAQKIKHLASANPEQYQSRVGELTKQMTEETSQRTEDLTSPPDTVSGDQESEAAGMIWPPKNLNAIFKLDLVQDKTAEEIEEIWKAYHIEKDCIFAVVKEIEFDRMMEKANQCPSFLYPLARKDGYEFFLSQFSRTEVYFTPLHQYQQLKEAVIPSLSVAHFTELKNDKGIVLMAGHYDNNHLTKTDALSLVRQMTLYYGTLSTDYYNLVRVFNHMPSKFSHLDLITEYNSMRKMLER